MLLFWVPLRERRDMAMEDKINSPALASGYLATFTRRTCWIFLAALSSCTCCNRFFIASRPRSFLLVIRRCQHCNLSAAPFSFSTCGASEGGKERGRPRK